MAWKLFHKAKCREKLMFRTGKNDAPRERVAQRTIKRRIWLLLLALMLTSCMPTSESNVIGYYLARQLGTLAGSDQNTANQPTTGSGSLSGEVTNPAGEAIAGASVLVASITGTPYATQSDAEG